VVLECLKGALRLRVKESRVLQSSWLNIRRKELSRRRDGQVVQFQILCIRVMYNQVQWVILLLQHVIHWGRLRHGLGHMSTIAHLLLMLVCGCIRIPNIPLHILIMEHCNNLVKDAPIVPNV